MGYEAATPKVEAVHTAARQAPPEGCAGSEYIQMMLVTKHFTLRELGKYGMKLEKLRNSIRKLRHHILHINWHLYSKLCNSDIAVASTVATEALTFLFAWNRATTFEHQKGCELVLDCEFC